MSTNRLSHVPKMFDWLQLDDNGRIDQYATNMRLREEFENIGANLSTQNDSTTELRQIVVGDNPVGPGGKYIAPPIDPDIGDTGDPGTPTVNTDEKVKIASGDTAGYLATKLFVGPGLRMDTLMMGGGGQGLIIYLENPVEQFIVPFNGKETTIYHPFSNTNYSFQVDKPMKDGGLAPVPYATYRKYPNRLWLRFLADDEHGVVLVTGQRESSI